MNKHFVRRSPDFGTGSTPSRRVTKPRPFGARRLPTPSSSSMTTSSSRALRRNQQRDKRPPPNPNRRLLLAVNQGRSPGPFYSLHSFARRAKISNHQMPSAALQESKHVQRFRRQLLHWYSRHKRDLPWRGEHDPYHIWVSEMMLQQTRVSVVTERYRRFLKRFP